MKSCLLALLVALLMIAAVPLGMLLVDYLANPIETEETKGSSSADPEETPL